MSLHTIETSVLAAAREKLENRKLRRRDLIEWSSGPVAPHDGETVVQVTALGTAWHVSVPSAADFRGLPPGTRGRKWPPAKAAT